MDIGQFWPLMPVFSRSCSHHLPWLLVINSGFGTLEDYEGTGADCDSEVGKLALVSSLVWIRSNVSPRPTCTL